eukprot:CAMPEP_0178401692 /NCGR_PEP_ID=MMETSP0689_2-20121128/16435_1 /TAXON_ID=160604 /ORGANISM="Amphidinium massartii, Strain CS-259" /LENGTH=127 /DNA_ID=CAMNT_0020022525 /DNA_START=85 /DNA_END=465 /DNA_ORIENTATION=+
MAPAQSLPAKVVLGTVACSLGTTWLTQGFVSNPALRSTSRAAQQSNADGARSNARASSGSVPGDVTLAAVGVAAAGTLAFASSKSRPAPRSIVTRPAYDASKEIGACDPLLFWDPIGYCTEGCTKED